jgi:hypothetical protein
MKSSRPPASGAALETRLLAPDVVLTTMRTRVTRQLAEEKLLQFRAVLARSAAPRWIIDQMQLDSFDPGAVAAGAEWFQAFKERHGREIIFVSKLSSARMVAASLAFSVRIHVTTFESLARAYAHVGLESALTMRI